MKDWIEIIGAFFVGVVLGAIICGGLLARGIDDHAEIVCADRGGNLQRVDHEAVTSTAPCGDGCTVPVMAQVIEWRCTIFKAGKP